MARASSTLQSLYKSTMNILTVNVGSSSVRLAIYDSNGKQLSQLHHHGSEHNAIQLLEDFLRSAKLDMIAAVGHRIVHGGERFAKSIIIDDVVEQAIADLSVLAPLHNPPALAWIRLCRERFGSSTPQVAVFDTAFYAELPVVARTYAIPHELTEKHGLRRFGFHGIAHRAMWQHWVDGRARRGDESKHQGRVISLQLGSGCSITAIRDGHAIDTSMGYSPLEGLVMATRPGDIDAGLVLHLQRNLGYSVDQLEHLFNEQAGLLGISALSDDLRELLSATTQQAQLAVELYCYRVRKYIGAYLAALQGADAILIGGGVGEHLPRIRANILHGMEWAGIEIDEVNNDASIGVAARIDAAASKLAIHVIPVDESYVVLKELVAVLNLDLTVEKN